MWRVWRPLILNTWPDSRVQSRGLKMLLLLVVVVFHGVVERGRRAKRRRRRSHARVPRERERCELIQCEDVGMARMGERGGARWDEMSAQCVCVGSFCLDFFLARGGWGCDSWKLSLFLSRPSGIVLCGV